MEQPRVEDALSFMNEIKTRFSSDEERIGLTRSRIGDGAIITRIQKLFEGHVDLLRKFAQFLPPDCGIDLTKPQPLQPAIATPANPYDGMSM
ncbi:hypothetical protein JH06_4128 [Blastocystis sp. subtype 4]|uniref:hypothetical protein n=1 Tax=Blastocystis sp. subtype 4 TaxID=944170 RepID=UPI0007122123|nr:hypothetical protein JH06_4128 [Blastocystis sp. subtype 4]KNB42313.1 hypothetical protein JH06_4128 [Blastocystis sp. subtype 4]|eukprot:XP_014525756.1 hypothetical protein JH06_4128 [Blastocystis sp. subtype 4]